MKSNYECPNCGYDFGQNDYECKYCGTKNPNYVAPKKGFFETEKSTAFKQVNTNNIVNNSTYVKTSNKSRALCGILQILLGGLGIGRFYSGHTNIGLAQLLVSVFTCGVGSIWGFVDGIMILVNSEFKDSEGNVMQ